MVSPLYLNKQIIHPNKQRGVVLVVSLVFLIALTAVAAALMQNTTTDMKMSGASEEKVIAIQEAIGGIDEIIHEQVTGISKDNDFASPIASFNSVKNCVDVMDGRKCVDTDIDIARRASITSATIELANNQFQLEADCPHSKLASSVQVFTCNILTIRVNRTYGRNGTSTVETNSGIAQHLLR